MESEWNRRSRSESELKNPHYKEQKAKSQLDHYRGGWALGVKGEGKTKKRERRGRRRGEGKWG